MSTLLNSTTVCSVEIFSCVFAFSVLVECIWTMELIGQRKQQNFKGNLIVRCLMTVLENCIPRCTDVPWVASRSDSRTSVVSCHL